MPKAKPSRSARRARMVEKKLSGKSNSAIAQEENLSREWVGHELATGESRQIIVQLVDTHLSRIAILFEKTLSAIEEGFGADQMANFQGAPVTLGPDHYARLAAAKRLIELVTAGRPTAKAPAEAALNKTVTLEELEQIVHGAKRRVSIQ